MIDLRPCVGCQRHIAITEEACPFCAAANAGATPHDVPNRRLSRAAAFATTVVLAGAGCGGGKPKADHVDHTQTTQLDAGTPQPPPEDARERPIEQDRGHHRGGGGNGNLPMPYGAPPARRRLV